MTKFGIRKFFEKNDAKSGNLKKKILIYVLLLILLFIWWRVEYKDDLNGYYEQAVEVGEDTFTASVSSVRNIVVTNNDPALQKRLDAENVTVGISIYSDDGEEFDTMSQPFSLHTNGYTSTESTIFDDMPLQLTEGKEYHVAYVAQLSDGTPLTQLSFLLYGEEKSVDLYSALLMAVMALILGIVLFRPFTRYELQFSLVWVLLIALMMIVMPALQTDRETGAFAKSYAVSSTLLGKNGTADANGLVCIEESGIRNNGYMTYRTPLLRFWLDNSYGNDRAENMGSVVYSLGSSAHILSVPSGFAVYLARSLHLGYRMVMMSGWLFGALLVWIFAMCAMKTAPEQKRFLGIVLCLPSSLMAAMSYTGTGILLGAGILLYAVLTRVLRTRTAQNGVLSAGLCIWAVGALCHKHTFLLAHTAGGVILGILNTLDQWMFTLTVCDLTSLYEDAILPSYLLLCAVFFLSPFGEAVSSKVQQAAGQTDAGDHRNRLEALVIGLTLLVILLRYNQF